MPEDTPWQSAGLNLRWLISGLTNGQEYAFEVRAMNSAGPGAAARAAATPLGVPTTPESLTATAGDGEVVLEWAPPADDGGSPVTGYEYRYAAGQAVPGDVGWRDAGTELTATVSGLENETGYALEVRARNRVGPGEAAVTTATPILPVAELFSSAQAVLEGESLVIGVRRSGGLAHAAHGYVGVTDSALPDVTATDDGRADGLGRHRLEFAAGAAEATVTVTVAFDGVRRENRVLTATLESVEVEIGGEARAYEFAAMPLEVRVTEGDAELSVADARAEAGSAALVFTVSLDRARDVPVQVDYATEDGSARAGEDYTPVSGTLTIEAGGRERTVEVPVLAALHVTGERTLTLRLSNAVSAVIDDGVATGVIVRESELPKAWLARFGRTASDHAAQAIARRLEAGQRETQVTVAGRRVDGLSVDGLLLGVLPSGGWRPASAVEDMATRLAAPALAASGAPFGGVDADPGTPGLRAGTWGGAPGALDREPFADAGETLRRAVLPDFGYRLPGAEEALLGTSFYVERGAHHADGGAPRRARTDRTFGRRPPASLRRARREGDPGGLRPAPGVVLPAAGPAPWAAGAEGVRVGRRGGVPGAAVRAAPGDAAEPSPRPRGTRGLRDPVAHLVPLRPFRRRRGPHADARRDRLGQELHAQLPPGRGAQVRPARPDPGPGRLVPLADPVPRGPLPGALARRGRAHGRRRLISKSTTEPEALAGSQVGNSGSSDTDREYALPGHIHRLVRSHERPPVRRFLGIRRCNVRWNNEVRGG